MANKKPQKSELFLSLEDTVEVVDNPTEIVVDGKKHVIESADYTHKVIEMNSTRYPGIEWIEVN